MKMSKICSYRYAGCSYTRLMKQIITRLIFACLMACMVFSVAACGGNRLKVMYEQKQSETIITMGVRSRAINRGLLEKERIVPLYIVLPESYASSEDKTYPVVYALHGFAETPQAVVNPLAAGLRAGGVTDVIFVGIDGSCALYGSFYANSPVSGYWEDAILEEIVPFIDKKYRTVSNPSGRMLAGYSMGGFASWNLALRHPDIFAAFWACCPGAWDENGQRDTLAGWQTIYRDAYGAVYAPDVNLPYPHARIPKFDGSPEDAAIQEKWEDGFGGIAKKLEEYTAGTARIAGGVFVYGSMDEFRWIPRGTRYIARKMSAAGLPVEIREFRANHLLTSEMATESFVPFVQRMFFSSGN